MARRKSPAARTFSELTVEQTESLRSLVRDHGSDWRMELQRRWLRGDYSLPGLLSLRNTHGGMWLESFAAPEDWYPAPAPVIAGRGEY